MASGPVAPTDCPLYEAPSCFRFALIKSLEKAATNYTPTNWRGFAEHFMLCVDASMPTPADLIHHWVDIHPNRRSHTISRVLDYAAAAQHRHLEQEFDQVMSDHLVKDYEGKSQPAECFAHCEKCTEWQPRRGSSPTTDTQERKKDKTTNGHVTCHHYNNGSVVNHYYNCVPNASLKTESPVFGNSVPISQASDHERKELVTKSRHSVAIHTASPHKDVETTHPRYRRCYSEGSNSKLSSLKRTCLNRAQNSVHAVDKLQSFGHSMFNTYPHRLFQRHYHGRKKEMIRILFVVFFLYQCFSAILMSICEDGGLRAVFKTSHTYEEIMNRFLKFSIRVMVRIFIPLCCSLQIPILASKPLVPKTGLTDKESAKRMMAVHDIFSSEEETEQIKDSKNNIYELSETMAKRKINCMWITVVHSILYVALLLYLGAFHACEENTLKGGVCNFLNPTIVWIPVLEMNFHIIVALESFSILIVGLVIGVTIDCYSYENWIGTYAVVIGGKAEQLFHEIRHRWFLMDLFSCLSPLVIATFALLSISTGKPFTPYPSQSMPFSDLVNWYFWIMVLAGIVLLGTSSNRLAKIGCLVLYVASGVFLFLSKKIETSHIPYGSIIFLLITSSSSIFLNFLYCLCLSHYYHATVSTKGSSRHSLCMLVVCLMCMAILLMSLVAIVYHEIAHFGTFFVSW